MFTGIISDVGEVLEITPRGELRRLVVGSAYDRGDDRARRVDRQAGVCLTAVGVEPATAGSASRSTSARRRSR